MKPRTIRRGEYIEVCKRNGTRKIIPVEVWQRNRRLKKVGAVLLVFCTMPLICGAASLIGRPEKVYAIMIMCAAALSMLLVGIIAGGDEE